VLEIAARPAKFVTASEVKAEPRVDCMFGEKLREQWMRELGTAVETSAAQPHRP
jgi:hypothetical protein